jgi:hypothetical protein
LEEPALLEWKDFKNSRKMSIHSPQKFLKYSKKTPTIPASTVPLSNNSTHRQNAAFTQTPIKASSYQSNNLNK